MPRNSNKYTIPSMSFDSADPLSAEMVNHTVYEDRCYVISFKNYKKKKCELENLLPASYKKALKWFRDIGIATSYEEIRNIGRGKPVKKGNEYTELFDRLPEDVEIKEYKLAGANRIFYYIDDAKRTIYCILIKNSHYEY